jgi:hypothetical protein
MTVTAAFVGTGGYFIAFFGFCAVLGLTTAVRGHGRSKWWGSAAMMIERPGSQLEDGRAQFAATGGSAAAAGFFGGLPLERGKKPEDPARVSLLKF